ncbi:MAG TPA: hypothetical protein VK901_09235, partial [Nitrospiraceae bacterium]|nr:hypothetical protein [Nitrospiraceae bacterium]
GVWHLPSTPSRADYFLLQGRFGRILLVMKRWALYLIAVPLGLGGLIYLVGLNFSIHFADMWSRDPQPKNTQHDVGKIPEGNAVPNEILRLRHRHQLRPLTEREEGTPIQNLPNGTYGFSKCSVVALRATRGNIFSLEIQKHDGIMFYVGYASDEEIERYLTRQKNFHVLMSAHPRKGASSLFDIPIEFVSKCEERPDGDGYLFDLFVTAIPELHI